MTTNRENAFKRKYWTKPQNNISISNFHDLRSHETQKRQNKCNKALNCSVITYHIFPVSLGQQIHTDRGNTETAENCQIWLFKKLKDDDESM